VDAGEGDGEGEIEEQLLRRGGPHKKEFPRKAVEGNVLIEFGIDPFNLLLLKFKYLRLGRLKSGIGPDIELFWR